MNTIIDQHILEELTAQAEALLRLRMNLDLRNSPSDKSQRMLNAIELGAVMPIHRHRGSPETVVCIRGHFEEYFYDAAGIRPTVVDMWRSWAIARNHRQRFFVVVIPQNERRQERYTKEKDFVKTDPRTLSCHRIVKLLMLDFVKHNSGLKNAGGEV